MLFSKAVIIFIIIIIIISLFGMIRTWKKLSSIRKI